VLDRPVRSDQVDTITALRSVLSLVLDGSNVPAVNRSRVLLFSGLIVVRIAFMAGFLKVVLQLFFCIATALTHRAQLLSRRRRMGVLMRAKIPQILAHTEMVSLGTGIRKARSRSPADLLRSYASDRTNASTNPAAVLRATAGPPCS
jgi:hypothetical protein